MSCPDASSPPGAQQRPPAAANKMQGVRPQGGPHSIIVPTSDGVTSPVLVDAAWQAGEVSRGRLCHQDGVAPGRFHGQSLPHPLEMAHQADAVPSRAWPGYTASCEFPGLVDNRPGGCADPHLLPPEKLNVSHSAAIPRHPLTSPYAESPEMMPLDPPDLLDPASTQVAGSPEACPAVHHASTLKQAEGKLGPNWSRPAAAPQSQPSVSTQHDMPSGPAGNQVSAWSQQRLIQNRPQSASLLPEAGPPAGSLATPQLQSSLYLAQQLQSVEAAEFDGATALAAPQAAPQAADVRRQAAATAVDVPRHVQQYSALQDVCQNTPSEAGRPSHPSSCSTPTCPICQPCTCAHVCQNPTHSEGGRISCYLAASRADWIE